MSMHGDPTHEEFVVLVDTDDRERGTMEKMEAHRRGELHRAFSVFVFDDHGRVLLQQRADGKYHSAGLWTNACCGHPRPGEGVEPAAARRAQEELGAALRPEWVFSFEYRTVFANGMHEHELDHVFIALYNGPFAPHQDEVKDLRWCQPMELSAELDAHPARFTVWLKECWHVVRDLAERKFSPRASRA